MIFRKPKPNATIQSTPGATKSIAKRFRRDTRGSTAIEFGILAIPFLALMFAVFESAMSFTAQQVISNATDRISRDIRTGEIPSASLNEPALRTLICDSIKIMVDDSCPDLEVDLQQYANFRSVPTTIPFTAGGDINTTGFRVTPGGASTINQMRIFYRWPVIADFMRSQMSNLPGNKTLLFATSTWRNESYD